MDEFSPDMKILHELDLKTLNLYFTMCNIDISIMDTQIIKYGTMNGNDLFSTLWVFGTNSEGINSVVLPLILKDIYIIVDSPFVEDVKKIFGEYYITTPDEIFKIVRNYKLNELLK